MHTPDLISAVGKGAERTCTRLTIVARSAPPLAPSKHTSSIRRADSSVKCNFELTVKGKLR